MGQYKPYQHLHCWYFRNREDLIEKIIAKNFTNQTKETNIKCRKYRKSQTRGTHSKTHSNENAKC